MTPPGSRSTTAAATGPSPNFAYLAHHDPRLAEVATRAERVLGLDPEGALNHLRLFGELVAKNAAARLGYREHADGRGLWHNGPGRVRHAAANDLPLVQQPPHRDGVERQTS